MSFAAALIEWHKHHGRHDLPWQNTRDPYRIWVSEIMLQQTQVTSVIPYYLKFLASFPDIQTLAQANIDEVLRHWSGLGYYTRARNLHRAAELIMQDHAGIFPGDTESVMALPGIGRSTAAAICAFAYQQKYAILDGNVKRVLARFCGIAGYPGEKKIENKLWDLADSFLPEEGIDVYTQALMDLGATICKRTQPQCKDCPLKFECVAFNEQRVHELPTPKPRKALPQKTTTMLMLLKNGEVLLHKRPPTGIWGGLWSLPELPDNKNSVDFCRTELGSDVLPLTPLSQYEHTFTHFKLLITPQPCHVIKLMSRVEQFGYIWLPLSEALDAALPTPVRNLLLQIEKQPSLI
jgi:A/G-specific adenine glycosylase